MVIIESAVFTRQIRRLMSDDELARFEALLVESPDSGDVIPEGGGLRKIRWTGKGRGKRGGTRIIYFWVVCASRIHLLLASSKNEKDDLNAQELKAIRAIVEGE
ncbi:MAG: type II toxin-antitoxin system RelE/ParE family toxin [Acidobacteria bacterium]|nr:type II toxin-antitoxin system RelE/ParE family toxin [Acidobacteriota bacterium]